MDKIIEDKELGRLVLTVNPRARRYIFRTKSDAIYVTVPPGATQHELGNAIDSLRSQLLDARGQLKPSRKIDLDYKIEADSFKLTLIQGNEGKYMAHSKLGEMKIVCPPSADFDNEGVQQWLQKVVEEALRSNAKALLPPRLALLSKKYNMPYRNVKINSSKSRWGSCSTRADINLSYYLMLLPQNLIDYVLLHELCHTIEMSHNNHFWSLMEVVTDSMAWELREELKNYRTEI